MNWKVWKITIVCTREVCMRYAVKIFPVQYCRISLHRKDIPVYCKILPPSAIAEVLAIWLLYWLQLAIKQFIWSRLEHNPPPLLYWSDTIPAVIGFHKSMELPVRTPSVLKSIFSFPYLIFVRHPVCLWLHHLALYPSSTSHTILQQKSRCYKRWLPKLSLKISFRTRLFTTVMSIGKSSVAPWRGRHFENYGGIGQANIPTVGRAFHN